MHRQTRTGRTGGGQEKAVFTLPCTGSPSEQPAAVPTGCVRLGCCTRNACKPQSSSLQVRLQAALGSGPACCALWPRGCALRPRARSLQVCLEAGDRAVPVHQGLPQRLDLLLCVELVVDAHLHMT